MKKLMHGLIATVLFGFIGNAQTKSDLENFRIIETQNITFTEDIVQRFFELTKFKTSNTDVTIDAETIELLKLKNNYQAIKLNMALDKNQIAKRIAQEVQNNYFVNLGIGIPTLVANYVRKDISVEFQSENGVLGMGPFPFEGQEDADIINAGKQTITTLPGASFFDSATSFGMIRGQHVDLTILGAMEVAENGDIANWKIPGKMVKGMGGAMDLVASAENIIVAMMHVNKAGESKILKKCTLPLTGVGCVKKIVTELAVLEVTPKGFKLLERAPGVSVEHIIASTEATLIIEGEIPEMYLD